MAEFQANKISPRFHCNVSKLIGSGGRENSFLPDFPEKDNNTNIKISGKFSEWKKNLD